MVQKWTSALEGDKTFSYQTLFSLSANISTSQLPVKIQQFISFTWWVCNIQYDMNPVPSSPSHTHTHIYEKERNVPRSLNIEHMSIFQTYFFSKIYLWAMERKKNLKKIFICFFLVFVSWDIVFSNLVSLIAV